MENIAMEAIARDGTVLKPQPTTKMLAPHTASCDGCYCYNPNHYPCPESCTAFVRDGQDIVWVVKHG